MAGPDVPAAVLSEVPLPWWLFVATAAVAGLRWGHLLWRERRRRPQREALRRQLAGLRDRLGRGQTTLPPTPESAGWRCRPVPCLDTDRRLVLLHEDAPRQRLPRFPGEEPARTVMFADGRVEWFSESAFERLLVGDDVLRERLGLPAIDADDPDADGREE